jgi:hypothetical protein
MKLKKRKETSSRNWFKKSIEFVARVFDSRKTKIYLLGLWILVALLIGNLFGLLISGFFGSLESPSPRAVDVLRSAGLSPSVDEILKANVRIPFYYIRGHFSDPERITIDINFENYQKILYKRAQFLDESFFFSSGEDFVPAKIRYGDQELDVELRLKGDSPEHLLGDKWSMRIKVKDDNTLFGMETFSIQNPRTRQYVNEFIFHEALKREGVLSLRYDFVEVVLNGENRGIFAIEEHFDKQLIESNSRKEGVIIKFNEDEWYKELAQLEGKNYYADLEEIEFKEELERNYLESAFFESNVDTFKKKTVLEDPVASAQFDKAVSLLESFKKGDLKTHEVFDVDKMAKYYAIVSLLGAEHAGEWTNIRFYYNPITSMLEPIGFDANSGVITLRISERYFPECLHFNLGVCDNKGESYYDLIFRDPVFFEKYVGELERVSTVGYLDSLFGDLDSQIKKNVQIIHKDTPYYRFSKDFFYLNQEYYSDLLNPERRSVIPHYQKSFINGRKIVLKVGNTDSLPIEILGLSYDGLEGFNLQEREILQPRGEKGSVFYKEIKFVIPPNVLWEDDLAPGLEILYKPLGASEVRKESVLPWAYVEDDFVEKDFILLDTRIGDREFLEINEQQSKIILKRGDWIIDQDLVLPEGYRVFAGEGTSLDLVGGATILSYSSLEFTGSSEKPIRIFSSDGTGQGLAVLNSGRESTLKNVVFDNLGSPRKQGWELTGGVNFYESAVKFEGVDFLNARAEDSLNLVSSEFEILNSKFLGGLSDCLDVDFGTGKIESSSFSGCGNDGIDLSGSNVDLNGITILNVGDKGLSVGEKSDIIAESIEIDGGYICIASKDQSMVTLLDTILSRCDYGFAVYQKKSEFGPAEIEVIGLVISDLGAESAVERDSILSINGKIILLGEEGVYDKLYGA